MNLTDGQEHDVALYLLDWPAIAGRAEQIQITSAATGAVLDTETVTNFGGGDYLQWELSGSVAITVEGLAYRRSLLSGIFFDPPSTSGGAAVDNLSISSAPTTDTAGIAQSFTVTAFSPIGGADTHYTGTVHFSSSDPQVTLPANYTFTTADAGVHIFTATLKTAGVQSITATDTVNASTAGTESNITVKPASAASLTVSGFPTPEAAGTAGNFTVTAYDPYGNVATGYAGSVRFTSSDPQAVLPGIYTFKSTDAGIHTFSATLMTAGTQSITATDSVTATITGKTSVTVNATGTSGTSAVFIKQDITTQGNWIGAYGSQGFNVIGDATSYPSYATVTATGETYQTWVGSTTDPRCSGESRWCWPDRGVLVLRRELYGRRESDRRSGARRRAVPARLASDRRSRRADSDHDAATGAVLDTETVTNFGGGDYLQWELSGSVAITVEGLAYRRSLLSGIFFDPVSSPQITTPNSLVARDAATHAGAVSFVTNPAITEIGTVDFGTTDATALRAVG